MAPADSASRAGATPKAGVDRSSRTFGKNMASIRKLATAAVVLILTACSAKAGQDTTNLSGQPSWFPLGEEVYQEGDRFEAEKGFLAFGHDARWFLGIPQQATKAEYEAWEKSESQTHSEGSELAEGGGFPIPTWPPYPKTINDLPSKAQGATLKLHISRGSNAGELTFALSLKAEKRAVKREIEHRRTNILPFLFAFYADGKAVKSELRCSSQIGGANSFIELVSAGSRQEWKINVDVKSIDAIAGPRVQELCIVAAFSERQHEDGAGSEPRPASPREDLDNVLLEPQITIRSNVYRIERTAQGWQPKDNS